MVNAGWVRGRLFAGITVGSSPHPALPAWVTGWKAKAKTGAEWIYRDTCLHLSDISKAK